MKIVVDENIPFGAEAFGTLGEVVTMAGREMTDGDVRDADALMVRSVTKVNADLLDGSSVKFVGTATIGFDHIDREYLEARGIGFASAPGCNALSVSEYLTAALLVLGRRGGFRLEGMTIGVIGVGNVGSRVVKKAEALGMKVLQNDPPLQRETGEAHFLPVERLLDEADVLTIHVPLTKTGQDATFHMIDDRFIGRMKKGAILFNTSRGAVGNNAAIMRGAKAKLFGGLILDVFEGEPAVDPAIIQCADIATPHIAGYSYDGKVRGTDMICRAACEFFDRPVEWDAAAAMPEPVFPEFTARGDCDDEDALREIVLKVYDIEADDGRLRQIADLPPNERGLYFDRLRKTYPVRREFPNTRVDTTKAGGSLCNKIAHLGFQVSK